MKLFHLKSPLKTILPLFAFLLILGLSCSSDDEGGDDGPADPPKTSVEETNASLWVTKFDKSQLLQKQNIPSPPLENPDKDIFFTEQWTGYPSDFGGDMSWHIKNVIVGATQNWSKNVLLWNLTADPNQGPHTDRGRCDDCIDAITISGESVERNVGYYIVGQISKFVKAGAMRVASTQSGGQVNTAFRNPSKEIVIEDWLMG